MAAEEQALTLVAPPPVRLRRYRLWAPANGGKVDNISWEYSVEAARPGADLRVCGFEGGKAHAKPSGDRRHCISSLDDVSSHHLTPSGSFILQINGQGAATDRLLSPSFYPFTDSLPQYGKIADPNGVFGKGHHRK
jgi:hypothetical protein